MSWRVIALLLASGASELRGQCPNGSPPPCGVRRAGASAPRVLPDSTRRLYLRGVAEGRRRTAEGARESVALMGRVIAADSNYAPAWSALAHVSQMAWIRRWSIAGAERDSLLRLAVLASRRAVQLDSGLASAWVGMARSTRIIDVTNRSATRRALSRALELDPGDTEALFELGLLEEELLRPEAARSAWSRALEIAPTHLETLTFLALHHFWASDFARARRLADSALAIDPTYSVAREAAAEVALAQKRWADAARHVDIGRRTGGLQEAAVAHSILVREAIGRGDVAEARRQVDQAERSAQAESPSRHEAVFVGAAWAAVGDTTQALRWLEAYSPRDDLHFQLHLKREHSLRWVRAVKPSLLTPRPAQP